MPDFPEDPQSGSQRAAFHRKLIIFSMAILILIPLVLGTLRLLGIL